MSSLFKQYQNPETYRETTSDAMNATMQTTQSMTASAAILNAQTNAAKAKTPHTHSALNSTINIQERVAAAEKAIKNKFLLLVDIFQFL